MLLFLGTILCYGQTGAGKTFTMTGATENYQQRGLIPRAIQQLFKEIEERTDYSINVRFVAATVDAMCGDIIKAVCTVM